MILYSEFTDGSQFSKEKNCLKKFFSVAQIINKQSKIEIIHFFGTPFKTKNENETLVLHLKMVNHAEFLANLLP